MVSKASEDFPEPDRPVNTTSLSRGISTSTFFRLCSRAPRMVMAREEDAFCWRLARSTSSISAFPGAAAPFLFEHDLDRKTGGHFSGSCSLRAQPRKGLRRQRGMLERRKNGPDFPVPRA